MDDEVLRDAMTQSEERSYLLATGYLRSSVTQLRETLRLYEAANISHVRFFMMFINELIQMKEGYEND